MRTSWTLGGIQVDLIAEDEGAFNPVNDALPGLPDDVLERERVWFDQHGYQPSSRRLVLSFHSFLVRVGGRALLVDSCVGNHKTLPFRPPCDRKTDPTWTTAFERTGVGRDDVDLVINTHLHLDHVGWNTTWTGSDWAPTFANARYVVSDTEYRSVQRRATPGSPMGDLHRTSLAESVEPLDRAGLLDRVATDERIDDHIRLIPTPATPAATSQSWSVMNRWSSPATCSTVRFRLHIRSFTGPGTKTARLPPAPAATSWSVTPTPTPWSARCTSPAPLPETCAGPVRAIGSFR